VSNGINYSQAAKTVDISTAGKVRKHLPKRQTVAKSAGVLTSVLK
jgi:hypothetical protein